MNKRIRKKKEKQSLMEASFEIVSGCQYKKRKQVVNELWKEYNKAGVRIIIEYKRKIINE